MKVCSGCGKKYQPDANFCPRAACATAGRPRRLSAALGVEVPPVARRAMRSFARKPGADDTAERLVALSRERPQRSEEAALKTYLARLAGMIQARPVQAADATVDFLRYFLPETSRHRPEPGERLRDWDDRDAPAELQNLRHRAHAAIAARLDEQPGDEPPPEGGRRRRRTQSVSGRFQSYFDEHRPRSPVRDPAALRTMTATQLALHVAALLEAAGVTDVSSWPLTGPHGADLLFSWRGRKVVVQLKGPDTAATNRMIRQAEAARESYGCHAVWLITNARVTPAVRTLAGGADVLLIAGDQLEELEALVGRQLRTFAAATPRRR